MTTEPSNPASSRVDESEAVTGLGGTPDMSEKDRGPLGSLLLM